MSDEPFHMWPYHKEESYTVIKAIKNHYPAFLKTRPDLVVAIHNAEIAMKYIDGEMTRMAELHPYEYEEE